MSVTTIPYQNTGYFSTLICDYLAEKEALKPFYGRFPTLDNFDAQLKEKKASFSAASRATLVNQLKKQYQNVATSEATKTNIESLSKSTTFTITTGHQLNLFTGPLYFLYKIFAVINLSEKLNKKHPDHHFVPVYWMATEDHDFDEINYFNYKQTKVSWNRESGGAVGELSTQGLEEVLEVFKNQLYGSDSAKQLQAWFKNAYVKHKNLAAATRFLANALFKKYGLVIIDGNDSVLKKAFVPFVKKDLTSQLSYQEVTKTTQRLEQKGYKEQVHPREINLFYIDQGIRERIIEKGGFYYVNNTDKKFSKEAITKALNNHPERFSPNALLRPLYQEVVLPNLCYVGGGGELAYWFQLKDYFEAVNVPFPMLLLRNSVLLVPLKLSKKLEKLEVDISDLFLKQHRLKTKYTKQLSEIEIDFTPQRKHLQKQFEDLYTLAKKTDASFVGAVAAQEKKQLNGLDHLEKRLLKAQKRKLADSLERLIKIQDQLFPQQSLQERTTNFSQFYVAYGDDMLNTLKEKLNPLTSQFTVINL